MARLAVHRLDHACMGQLRSLLSVEAPPPLIYRSDNDDGPDVLRWLDRMLIRLVSVNYLLSLYLKYYFLFLTCSVRNLESSTKMILALSSLGIICLCTLR